MDSHDKEFLISALIVFTYIIIAFFIKSLTYNCILFLIFYFVIDYFNVYASKLFFIVFTVFIAVKYTLHKNFYIMVIASAIVFAPLFLISNIYINIFLDGLICLGLWLIVAHYYSPQEIEEIKVKDTQVSSLHPTDITFKTFYDDK